MQNSNVTVTKLFITQPFGKPPVEVEKIELLLEGIKHDRHFGIKKIADIRETYAVPKGTEVLNLRAVTIVAEEELKEIATSLSIENVLSQDLEANICIKGLDNLTQLPIGTLFKFPRHAILYTTGENLPCYIPGQHIASRIDDKSITHKFAKAALHKRGITALAYTAGIIKVGDSIEVIYRK